MKFIEALYGSQYYELSTNGKDGMKGRVNGNLLLSAFLTLFILLVLMLLYCFSINFEQFFLEKFHNYFAYFSGKTTGKIVAIPIFALIYFIITKTVGSQENFIKNINKFMKHTDLEKQKANRIIIKTFMIIVFLIFILTFFEGF
ncbi:MAG: hypothetical protein PHC28_09185 [Flavobacterium sp.]|uniref:hypothetical protein n=1 Tax=Flavobacterium sp. TaxID=239 RepID=UPI0026254F8E|nr:hypothetical protein [Flavobacterium sp.]MDD5150642.1 hypothetical protein [Flavobacterium sp.]